MSFKLNISTVATTSNSENQRQVDWEALNKHVIEAAGTANKARSIPGVISGIYDLGEQNREPAMIDTTDAEFKKRNPEFDGSESSQAVILAKYKDASFVEEDGKLFLTYPQKPVQQVAIAVDFPQVLVDKGQFFGNSKPLPLRMLLNGEFSVGNGERVVAKPYNLTVMKHDDGTYAFAKNNGLHKLADACEILDAKGYFKPERVGELLGKVAQFQFRVYMKPSKKDSSKKFFTEEIKLAGMVPEGIPIPEIPDGILHGVNLVGENDPDAVKQLRLAVKNTIKKANNYPESDIRKLLEDGAEQNPAAKKEVKQEVVEPEEDFDDSDLPF